MMNMQESAPSTNDVGYYARSWGTTHSHTYIHTYSALITYIHRHAP